MVSDELSESALSVGSLIAVSTLSMHSTEEGGDGGIWPTEDSPCEKSRSFSSAVMTVVVGGRKMGGGGGK